MVRAADDDVRFLPYVFHKMMEKLSEESLWKLAVCGSLCCRCFCISDNEYADWPAIPSIPGDLELSTKAMNAYSGTKRYMLFFMDILLYNCRSFLSFMTILRHWSLVLTFAGFDHL